MKGSGSILWLWRRGVIGCARRLPVASPATCMASSAVLLLGACLLLPGLEAQARAMPGLSAAIGGWPGGWSWLRLAEAAMAAGAGLGACLLQARCLQLCYPETYDPDRLPSGPAAGRWRGRRGGLIIAGMPVSREDLRTSVLVTGVTGSSKTAGVLLPALAQLLATYNRENDDELSSDEFQKLGAFVPEVKGDLVDACIYLAHEAGRCVSRDVLILAPSCRIPVIRYRDEAGRPWHLCARGGAGGSDAALLMPRLRHAPGHPRAGRLIAAGVFEDPAEAAAILPELSRVAIPLEGRRPRFIGWRWSGRSLLRVSHTEARDRTIEVTGPGGGPLTAAPPRTLAPEAVLYVDNGIRYNLVDPRLPPSEAAERLTRLAAMVRGVGSRGENDYFYEQGRKVIAACISLHRAVEPEPCTAADIVRLATQDERLGLGLERLAEVIRLRRGEADSAGGEERAEFLRRLAPLEDLEAYFRCEWRRMVADGKTANVIKSTISSAFDPFLRDPDLAETFCRPSTFSFEDVPQAGKIVALVPGDRYEQLGRLIGTACKLDFQSTLLARNGRADLNGSRLVLYCADECHKYIVSGSAAAGDPYFMNLSRSNNVVNLCATQSYAWITEVIGREAANVYISAFGVQFWLQQTDPETCRRAAEICGTLTRERLSIERESGGSGWIPGPAGGKGITTRRRLQEERQERFRPEEFAQLDVGDIVAYNKGRPGRWAKVTRGRAAYLPCTRAPEGPKAVAERVRQYYREVVENLTHERGEGARWDARAA